MKRRLLIPPKEAEVFFSSLDGKIVCGNAEWLVKWKDLGYEHATWELESSSFLCTPEAEELKRSYEHRFEAARKASDPSKVDKVCHRKHLFVLAGTLQFNLTSDHSLYIFIISAICTLIC